MTGDPIGEVLLTIEDMCRRWQCGHLHLWRMRAQGDGPPWFRIGQHKVRYRLGDVQAWEQQQTQKNAKV